MGRWPAGPEGLKGRAVSPPRLPGRARVGPYTSPERARGAASSVPVPVVAHHEPPARIPAPAGIRGLHPRREPAGPARPTAPVLAALHGPAAPERQGAGRTF